MHVQAQRIDDFHAVGFAEHGGFGLGAQPRVRPGGERFQRAAQLQLFRHGDGVHLGVEIVHFCVVLRPGKEELLVRAFNQRCILARAFHKQLNGFIIQRLRGGVAHLAVYEAAETQSARVGGGIIGDFAAEYGRGKARPGGVVDLAGGKTGFLRPLKQFLIKFPAFHA